MGELEKNRRGLWHRTARRPRVYRPGPFALIYLVLLAAGLAASAEVYHVLVQHVPGMAANRPDAVKTALLVIGGSGALAGLYVAYRKQRTDEANHLRDLDKLFTERYTAAVGQLGNTTSAAIRLGGVYALARIADDSERDRSTCLEVLCAYLRMPYDPDDPETEPAEQQVRTTAQSAIAARLRSDHPGFWPDARIDLSDACLIDLNFSWITVDKFRADRATFRGHTRFHYAMFGTYAWFGAATFGEIADFQSATFGTNAWFGGVTFGGDAQFDGATFNRDPWQFGEAASFGGVTFRGVKFGRNARFSGATFHNDAWFNPATFSGNALFDRATFNGDAVFGGATFHKDVGFDRATFRRTAEFGRARFDGVTRFDRIRFHGAAGFGEATFHRDKSPVWPGRFIEPTGIVWIDPPAPVPAPPPDPAAPPPVP